MPAAHSLRIMLSPSVSFSCTTRLLLASLWRPTPNYDASSNDDGQRLWERGAAQPTQESDLGVNSKLPDFGWKIGATIRAYQANVELYIS